MPRNLSSPEQRTRRNIMKMGAILTPNWPGPPFGANGYIPMAMGFEITIEAARFVLAGGTYVPMNCLLGSDRPGDAPSRPPTSGLITAGEWAVVRAIQQGKSNKVIAHEMNMCESTVKVRRIMKKLKAKNRKEVAIYALVAERVDDCCATLFRG